MDNKQGYCKLNNKDPSYMHDYDQLTTRERKIIRESPYDLCVMCLIQMTSEVHVSMENAIEYFERQIRLNE